MVPNKVKAMILRSISHSFGKEVQCLRMIRAWHSASTKAKVSGRERAVSQAKTGAGLAAKNAMQLHSERSRLEATVTALQADVAERDAKLAELEFELRTYQLKDSHKVKAESDAMGANMYQMAYDEIERLKTDLAATNMEMEALKGQCDSQIAEIHQEQKQKGDDMYQMAYDEITKLRVTIPTPPHQTLLMILPPPSPCLGPSDNQER
jgi:predicted RNase H-like nuclease (RuvC/YqgF family)